MNDDVTDVTISVGVLNELPDLITLVFHDIGYRLSMPVEDALKLTENILYCAKAIKEATVQFEGHA